MKTTIFLSCFCLATLGAYAGTPVKTTPPPANPPSWNWFAAGSVGYLTDLDEDMYHLQAGATFDIAGCPGGHALYLEVGYTGDDYNDEFLPNLPGARYEEWSVDMDIIPITLNYRYDFNLTGPLKGYVGAGAGVAIVDTSYDWEWRASYPPFAGDDDGDETDVKFYGQLFAGLAYDINAACQVFVGARYIMMDEASCDVDGSSRADYEAGIDGDWLIELGLRYQF